jgi:hypothetical protein
MINWKIVAIFAVFAAVIAIFSGVLGGVSFFEIIVRTIVWSIVFAGIGAVFNLVLNKYLPELLEITGSEKYSKTADGEFEAIIPEENPHVKGEKNGDDSGFYDDSDSASDEESMVEELEEEDQHNEVTGEATADEDTYEEESSEVLKETSADTSMEMGSLDSSDEMLDDDDDSDTETTVDEPGETDELDVLPEIDSFASSFSHVGGDANSEESTFETRSTFGKSKIDSKVSDLIQDPSKTAKAIHTWIERDKD